MAERSKRTMFTQVLDPSLEMRGSNPGAAIYVYVNGCGGSNGGGYAVYIVYMTN